MARIRTIKPEFWTDEDMAEVSEAACLLAIGLLNYADDEGYFNANPKLIKAAVFPIREPSVTIPVMLRELSNHGYLCMFSTSDNRHFGLIQNFAKHQVVNKPRPSKIKGMELLPYDYGSDTGGLPLGMDQGSGNGKDKTPLYAREENSPVPEAEPPQEDHPPFPLNGNNFGKFQMFNGWIPGRDFVQSAALWGRSIGEGYSPPELAEFVTYWIAEGKIFQQTQWEQKFAQSIVKRRAIESKSGVTDGQIQQTSPTGGRAVERIRAAIAAEREREGLPPVGNDGRDVFGSLGSQERDDAVIDLESGDWRAE